MDGAAFSVMVGMGETYLPAFVLAVGLGQILAGLTATIPMLVGAVLQLAAPRMMRRVGSHRRWVVLCSFLQAVTFIPLSLAAVAGRISWPAVLLIAALYWGSGLAAGPAWNTWMARVVPPRLRATFFARRTRATQLAVLGGLLAGGVVLQLAATKGGLLLGFAALFAAACCFRMISACFLLRQREPAGAVEPEQRLSLAGLWDRHGSPEGRLLVYMLVVQMGTYLAAPYFTPFMLGHLRLPYSTYMGLLAVAFLAKTVALPAVGRFTQRSGTTSLLWIGGVGVVPLACLWTISTATWYLTVLQILGGVAWACYELATLLLLFELIRDKERTSVLTWFNVLNAVAIAAGSLVGSLILRLAGGDHGAYMLLFLLSSTARLFALVLLRRVTAAPRMPIWAGFRTLAVRPSSGSIDRPILATIPEQGGRKDEG